MIFEKVFNPLPKLFDVSTWKRLNRLLDFFNVAAHRNEYRRLFRFSQGTFLKRDGKWQAVNWQATAMPKKNGESVLAQASSQATAPG